MFASKDLIFAKKASGSYAINNSLRFRSSASAYLSRTPATAGNRKTWTLSAWIKRGALGNMYWGGNCDSGGLNGIYIQFQSNDTFLFAEYGSASYNWQLVTSQVFRDPSAWYHFVLAVDTTQATSSNRVKIYINGSQVSSFGTSTYPSLNYDTYWNAAQGAAIGRAGAFASAYYDGYLCEINNIDGQALTPSSFGQTDATTGVWQPKAYTGTYGTNGFYLKFSDIALTSGSNAGLGKDFSGNTNYWNTNGISVSAGVTYDAMVDSPTNSAAASNYCVLNPLNNDSTNTLSAGNLNYSIAANASGYPTSTFQFSSGKWYWEDTVSSTHNIIGILLGSSGPTTGLFSTGYGYYGNTGVKYVNGTSSAYGATFTTNDVIGVAVDLDSGTPTITFYKNNVSQGSLTIAAGTYKIGGGNGNSAAVASGSYNFGQRPFTYTPPSGFVALNTQNLPTPTIAAGNKHFDVSLYTGTGASQSITNSSAFQPDFLWIKSRSVAASHILVDAVRTVSQELSSNDTAAETTNSGRITSFNSNGWSLGATSAASLNQSSATYVGWQWKANGAGSSNTSGSITSTVSANVSAGFSVVTYTGASTTGTVGHGLGVAPSMIIVKTRNAVADWYVYHVSNGLNKYMYMNLTNAVVSAAGYFDTVSSTVFGGTSAAGIISTSNFVAYCFAPVAGYSAFGSYTGNGSADGPFVFTGFRPRLIMVKRTDTTADWVIVDTTRNTYNLVTQELYPDLSNAESASTNFDILSNGFKLRGFAGYVGASGGTYIYAAFAENPFSIARAR